MKLFLCSGDWILFSSGKKNQNMGSYPIKTNCFAVRLFLWISFVRTSTTTKSIKKPVSFETGFASSGDWTRTSDLRVMSPTSYLLLYPAVYILKVYHLFRITFTLSASRATSGPCPERSRRVLLYPAILDCKYTTLSSFSKNNATKKMPSLIETAFHLINFN